MEGITSEGNALVRCENLPDLGAAVYDGEHHRIGTVRRILGQVDAPYASVAMDDARPNLKGAKLFFSQGGNGGRPKRKGKRN